MGNEMPSSRKVTKVLRKLRNSIVEMDKQKAMSKLRYWKMVEIKLVRKRGKS